jgi:hypothetical protein
LPYALVQEVGAGKGSRHALSAGGEQVGFQRLDVIVLLLSSSAELCSSGLCLPISASDAHLCHFH